MPNPKHRHSKTRTATRRSHHALEVPTMTTCSHCGAAVLYHRVCPKCGYYRGKLAIVKEVAE
jgi:large subunit ribosomal protein L32